MQAMNTPALHVLNLALILCAAGSARQAMSADINSTTEPTGATQVTASARAEEPYIKRGYYDLAFSGSLSRYHYNGGVTSGSLSADLGYYVSNRIMVGGGLGFSGGGGAWSPSYRARFRYLIPTRNPRAYVFFGAVPGGSYLHSGTYSSNAFSLLGEAGLKYFVVRNVSVETAYNFAFVHQAAQFASTDRSTSSIRTGLAFTFGH